MTSVRTNNQLLECVPATLSKRMERSSDGCLLLRLDRINRLDKDALPSLVQ